MKKRIIIVCTSIVLTLALVFGTLLLLREPIVERSMPQVKFDNLTAVKDRLHFQIMLYSRKDCDLMFGSGNLYNAMSLNYFKPVEHVQRVSDDHICVVFKIQEKDLDPAYVYVFFARDAEELTLKEKIGFLGDHHNWTKTHEFYFVSKSLCYADFESLKVGDCAKAVNEIDSSTMYELDGYNYNGTTSYKLLRDGVLWIDYERDVYRISDDRLDSFFIKDIRFYPYGCGESVDFVSILDGEWRPILPD